MGTPLIGIVAAGILAAHGIGHVLGWMPALGVASFDGLSGDSWLLSGAVGPVASRAVAAALFLVPTAGFVLAAGGLLLGQPWWRQVAVTSAGVSLLAMALYPQAFAASSTVGSVAVDVIVLYGILVARWGIEAGAA